ncbi:MAG: DUF4157 domain-containing protein [Gemmatimonadaceae bacterium]
MGAGSRLIDAVIGQPIQLPSDMVRRFPELERAKYRRGGLPVRLGGWALGASTAAAITLWKTVFLAPSTPLSAELLLHELRHVHQFLERRTFPVRYLWQSIRYGYARNPYEVDARSYSASRLDTADKDL